MSRNEIADQIVAKQRQINILHFEIEEIAETYVPGYNYLDFKVSTEWHCDSSPVGMCVFVRGKDGRVLNCRYCEDPEERK